MTSSQKQLKVPRENLKEKEPLAESVQAQIRKTIKIAFKTMMALMPLMTWLGMKDKLIAEGIPQSIKQKT